jgi:hypothetical protein
MSMWGSSAGEGDGQRLGDPTPKRSTRLRTEITEIVTGLAMLGYQSLDRALEVRPRHISHVDDEVFDRLEQAWASGEHPLAFTQAWESGLVFARSDEGLRGRPPWSLEWKGPHRPASKRIETIPADLRVDHVYLISCKYGSEILHNSSPAELFDHCLHASAARATDWYETVAPEPYRAVWEPVMRAAGVRPGPPQTLDAEEKRRVKAHLRDSPVDTGTATYREFVAEVADGSAQRWRAALSTVSARREMVWRLLRMQAAPYFLLGADKRKQPLRYRISTPWDFQQRFEVSGFEVAASGGGQPRVDWRAVVTEAATGAERVAEGHVEVRWSHGKLQGVPEAKVYLATDPHHVPGYVPLGGGPVGPRQVALPGTEAQMERSS